MHFVGVHPSHRRLGLGRRLYDRFFVDGVPIWSDYPASAHGTFHTGVPTWTRL